MNLNGARWQMHGDGAEPIASIMLSDIDLYVEAVERLFEDDGPVPYSGIVLSFRVLSPVSAPLYVCPVLGSPHSWRIELKAVIFCGPTIDGSEVLKELGAELGDSEMLPPVSQGDVYRAAVRQPDVIGIIDGYFRSLPAVWHKEILWAMDQGIHVYGAASMGALRAAELEAFGMTGVGEVFEHYRDGVIEDDDEVAVVHGPAETGFRAVSDAMVNIRATLRRAEEQGIILSGTREILEKSAKSLSYEERSYERMIEVAKGRLPVNERHAFRSWLLGGKVDQKKNDARAMLRVIRERVANGLEPKEAPFSFERTLHWENLKTFAADEPTSASEPDALVLAELRGDEELAKRSTYAAVALLLADERARDMGVRLNDSDRQAWTGEFCRRRQLKSANDVVNWLVTAGCSMRHLRRLIDCQAYFEWAKRSESEPGRSPGPRLPPLDGRVFDSRGTGKGRRGGVWHWRIILQKRDCMITRLGREWYLCCAKAGGSSAEFGVRVKSRSSCATFSSGRTWFPFRYVRNARVA